MKDIALNQRIIFALDVQDPQTAHQWIDRLESHIGFYKIGFELFLGGGLPLVKEVIARGHKVMLDLKLYDVPATVSRTLAQLSGLGISFATIHGDRAIIQAAAQVKSDVGLLAVTVLTSLDQQGVQEIGMTEPLQEVVMKKAQLAVSNGCAGVVASPREAQMLRTLIGDNAFIVSPGIRPDDSAEDDQKRTMSVTDAVTAGVDYLVIGRPIRDADDPLQMAKRIQQQIDNVTFKLADK